jgi:phosphoenolpyruvate phosphomutase
MSSTSRLRQLLGGPNIVRVIGAHNALGARLGERAGFDAVWASGLELSASHGVPDADILTMGDLLAVIRWITSAVEIPVIADCDAGYGNASNVAHMVRRYEAAGVAGVCIEDKVFPKTNSFISGRQRLVSIPEFVGKLSAAKAAQTDRDFVVIGRVEALIAGYDLDEALRRASAYEEAGADAILIHAKGESPQPILDFIASWSSRVPVVVVPTTYHRITGHQLQEAGARMVIYANHGLRAGTKAVMDVFTEILRTDSTTSSEPNIAPLSTIFELQRTEELLAHDSRYVPGAEAASRAANSADILVTK